MSINHGYVSEAKSSMGAIYWTPALLISNVDVAKLLMAESMAPI